ncbi:MAG: hypothetical protein JO257_35585 [Deltaproteobacteria bacterium]|nr:hypothetical protein [Deltaproteobacteria bacterium]
MRRALLLLLMVIGACHKKSGPTSRDGVIDAWKKGGLQPSAFTEAKTDLGKDCASGTVNKLDVMVCTYPSDKDAKAAEDAGLKWVGDTTGASRAQGDVLIVVADRKKADPNGKTINQIVTLPAK